MFERTSKGISWKRGIPFFTDQRNRLQPVPRPLDTHFTIRAVGDTFRAVNKFIPTKGAIIQADIRNTTCINLLPLKVAEWEG